jgi:hypothetical protein
VGTRAVECASSPLYESCRLRDNFADTDIGEEGYFEIENALPIEKLSSLKATFAPLEQSAMFRAALDIIHFYKDVAPLLAQAHGIPYPDGLERVMVERLEKLSMARGQSS